MRVSISCHIILYSLLVFYFTSLLTVVAKNDDKSFSMLAKTALRGPGTISHILEDPFSPHPQQLLLVAISDSMGASVIRAKSDGKYREWKQRVSLRSDENIIENMELVRVQHEEERFKYYLILSVASNVDPFFTQGNRFYKSRRLIKIELLEDSMLRVANTDLIRRADAWAFPKRLHFLLKSQRRNSSPSVVLADDPFIQILSIREIACDVYDFNVLTMNTEFVSTISSEFRVDSTDEYISAGSKWSSIRFLYQEKEQQFTIYDMKQKTISVHQISGDEVWTILHILEKEPQHTEEAQEDTGTMLLVLSSKKRSIVPPICIFTYNWERNHSSHMIDLREESRICDYNKTAIGVTFDELNNRLLMVRENSETGADQINRLYWSMFYFDLNANRFEIEETRSTQMTSHPVFKQVDVRRLILNPSYNYSFTIYKYITKEDPKQIIAMIGPNLQGWSYQYSPFAAIQDIVSNVAVISSNRNRNNSTNHVMLAHTTESVTRLSQAMILVDEKTGNAQVENGAEYFRNSQCSELFTHKDRVYMLGTRIQQFNTVEWMVIEPSTSKLLSHGAITSLPVYTTLVMLHSSIRETEYFVMQQGRKIAVWYSSYHNLTDVVLLNEIMLDDANFFLMRFFDFADTMETNAILYMEDGSCMGCALKLWTLNLMTGQMSEMLNHAFEGDHISMTCGIVHKNSLFLSGHATMHTETKVCKIYRYSLTGTSSSMGAPGQLEVYEYSEAVGNIENCAVASCHLDHLRSRLYLSTVSALVLVDISDKKPEFVRYSLVFSDWFIGSIFGPNEERALFFSNANPGATEYEPAAVVVVATPKQLIASRNVERLVLAIVFPIVVVIALIIIIPITVFCLIQVRSSYKKRQIFIEMEQQLLEFGSSSSGGFSTHNETDRYILDVKDIKFTERISEGASGVVFKGKWKNIPVAVKKMKRSKSEEDHESFIREAQMLIQLRHTNVVLFLGICMSDDYRFIVTEFLDNGSLDQFLNGKFKLLSFSDKILILSQVSQAMIYLHSLKPSLIHRDLKPQNILLDKHMQAKICDFGLSKFDEGEGNMTGYIGTLHYMAPEVLGSNDHYDTSCDVYSFGMIMYQVLFEAIPFSMESCNQYMLAVEVLKGRRPVVPWHHSIPANNNSMMDSDEKELMKKWCHERNYPTKALGKCIHLMNSCWTANADERPSFEQVYEKLETIFNSLIIERSSVVLE